MKLRFEHRSKFNIVVHATLDHNHFMGPYVSIVHYLKVGKIVLLLISPAIFWTCMCPVFVRPNSPVRPRFKSVGLHDAQKSTASMSYDYAACQRSLEYLFRLDAIGKIKFLIQFRIFKAQVPPSEKEETVLQNHIEAIDIHLYIATLKLIPAFGQYTRSAVVITNPQPHWEKKCS
ncbi:hypothetical protein TNCV_3419391 [Trichonephila clavipes]|nr:hypothetical protein TNCV_3419391 [Trichonephila clavipes]